MTDRELMQQALDALEEITRHFSFSRLRESMLADTTVRGKGHEAMKLLRVRLAQPEQEPVATLFGSLPVYDVSPKRRKPPTQDLSAPLTVNGVPMYPQREWQGLTDEEQMQAAWSCGAMSADWLDFARAIESKLKEKNA